MRNSIILLIGPSCSGKTHWSEEMRGIHYIRIAEDELLQKMYGSHHVSRFVKDAAALATHTILATCASGNEDIVLDADYLSLERIDKIVDTWNNHYDITYKVFNVPKDLLKRRMELRMPSFRISDKQLDRQIELTKQLAADLEGYKGMQLYQMPAYISAYHEWD